MECSSTGTLHSHLLRVPLWAVHQPPMPWDAHHCLPPWCWATPTPHQIILCGLQGFNSGHLACMASTFTCCVLSSYQVSILSPHYLLLSRLLCYFSSHESKNWNQDSDFGEDWEESYKVEFKEKSELFSLKRFSSYKSGCWQMNSSLLFSTQWATAFPVSSLSSLVGKQVRCMLDSSSSFQARKFPLAFENYFEVSCCWTLAVCTADSSVPGSAPVSSAALV